jgi:hypothetical protein
MRVSGSQGQALVFASVVVWSAGCASSAGRTPGREIAGGVKAPVARLITQLPDDATFAWVPPAQLLTGVKPVDAQSIGTGAVMGLRADITTLLLSRSWREAAPAEADYLVTFVRIHQGVNADASDIPANSTSGRSYGMPICRGVQGESRGVTCRAASEPLARRGAASWMAFVLKRRADGAQYTKTVPILWDTKIADLMFVESTLRLFLAGER